MRFIDLFGGIGGFRLGLERCGHECVYYCDWDKHAVSVYNKNFREKHEPADITKVDAGSIPDHDILCGGFPDGWTSTYPDGEAVSDSQRYKMLGNSVVVPVIESIGKRLGELAGSETSHRVI